MKQLILLLCMGLLLISTTVAATDRVQDVKVMQQGNRMVLEYTLTGDKPATVSFTVTVQGQKQTADKLHLEGDYGKNVTPGKRRLVWNVLQDFPRGLQGKVDWSLTAGGGGGGTDPTTGMEFVAVPGGFSIGKYEVTQGQWKKVMGKNPSRFRQCGDNCPVEQVSWNDVQQFIQRLNSQSDRNYRLPTEAEWEYVCKAGDNHIYCGSNDIAAVAWYGYNSSGHTHQVGKKQPNAWGIYDMSGNVWEWVQDLDRSMRVLRGRSWSSRWDFARAGDRGRYDPTDLNGEIGFRLVLPQD